VIEKKTFLLHEEEMQKGLLIKRRIFLDF